MNRELIEALSKTHRAELDIDKNHSYGVKGAGDSAWDERAKAIQLSWVVENRTTVPQFLVMSSLFEDGRNDTIFPSIRAMLTACVPGVPEAQVHAFRAGTIWVKSDDAAVKLTATSNRAGRDIDQFLRYIGENPTRLTKMNLTSTKALANVDEASNFENDFKTMFFSPFDSPIENTFGLSNLRDARNLTQNLLTIDFIDQAFPVVLSREHYFIFMVNPDTRLTMNAFVGAQNSQAQRFWRQNNRKDDLVRQYGIGKTY